MDYKKIFKDTEKRLKLIYKLSFLPDKFYLKFVFWIKTGRKLNLKNPTGFNEKQNWLKLYDKHPEHTPLVDKIAVRDHITKELGEGYLFPLLGYWKSYDDIDFSKLPNRFVLKCNHDSGSVKLIMDKAKINHAELREFFENHLRMNAFSFGREFPYKGVKPYIMCEKYMESKNNSGLTDYKFFCFDGEPKIMFVATDRAVDVKFDFFDMDFNHLDIYNIHPNADREIEKPETFDQMKDICRKLTKGIRFVRLDLYEIDGKIYFGEYTFYHGGGFHIFQPEEWEQRLGKWLYIEELDGKRNN